MNKTTQIKRGDIVWLKTGGPAMTVKWEDESQGGLVCSWFDGYNVIQEHLFSIEQLTLENPNYESSF